MVALLVTFLIAGALGLTHRSDRIGWRTTDDGDPKTAVGVVHEVHDMVDGDPLTRFDLAITNPQRNAELPPPPGLPHAPKPGEVFVSPEFAKHWKPAATSASGSVSANPPASSTKPDCPHPMSWSRSGE